MNLFKNVLKATLVLALIFLFSCEKEQNVNNNTLTEEIGKVETRYQQGDIKLENIVDPNFQKVETSASESYKAKILQDLEKSYSKQTTYLKSAGNTVGVIKSGGTCGSYVELYMYMDCEDGSGNISAVNGWVGDCERTSGGNIILRFCVVNGAYFERTNSDYAVLNLTGLSSWPYGVNYIYRYFDNEDYQNANNFTLNGNALWDTWLGRCYLGANTGLGFYHYISNSDSPSYPSLGFSYGVFGQFGSNLGSIVTDDEDNGNANTCQTASYDYANLRLGTLYDRYTNIPSILNVGNNTTLYVSKVN